MIVPRDYAVDTFEAALATLCGVYIGAGLSEAEVRAALARRLRSLDRHAAARAAAANDAAPSPSEGDGGGDADGR